VQIAGTDAAMMAGPVLPVALDHRHQHGLPCQKVCNKWAGSALMQDRLWRCRSMQAVVDAYQLHVLSLKMRHRQDADARLPLAGVESAGVQ
jgi:tRNA-dihydrouridine synthase B